MAKHSVISGVQFDPRYDRVVIVVFRKMTVCDLNGNVCIAPKRIEHHRIWNENILTSYNRFLKMIELVTFRQMNDWMRGYGFEYDDMCYFSDGEIKPGYVMIEERENE